MRVLMASRVGCRDSLDCRELKSQSNIFISLIFIIIVRTVFDEIHCLF